MGTHSDIRGTLHSILRAAGKREHRVIAVFGLNPTASAEAVRYVRTQVPDVPVWLFSTQMPPPETAARCERVYVHRNFAALLVLAQVRLWPQWVALSVGTWTGERGGWALKLAPFLVPPFRALLMNQYGGFFSGALGIARHLAYQLREGAKVQWQAARGRWRALADTATSGWHRTQDLGRAYWLLISYHIWRSGPCRRVQHIGSATLLLATATVLKWCGYPQRRWFKHRNGSRTLIVDLAAQPRGGVERFLQHRDNRLDSELEAAARASHARWILWQTEDLEVRLGDLLPLFQDDRTFAVSVQTQFRGWKPSLLPMAPFRELQNGEACQVMAPISPVILVDRQKLLALGIPRYGQITTSWMVLFWKAAAAGWRSYSVGQGRQIIPQPDFPVHETAFVLQTIRDRRLRELGPAEPDLARGATAFYPRMRSTSESRSDRPRVLIVSPFLPYPMSHGGAVRISNLCRALRHRVDFILAAIREKGETVHYGRLHDTFQQVAVVDLDESPLKDKKLPAQVRHYASRSLRALIGDLCARCRPDLIQIEYTHMALFRDAAPELPAVLVEHDLTLSLYSQLAEREPVAARRREYQRWAAFERHQWRRFDSVWTVSGEDRCRAIAEGADPSRTHIVPNGVDTSFFTPENELAEIPEVLFVGSFRHLPNILGFEKLCREIMPRVWSEFPEVRLRIVAGTHHEQFWRALRGGNALPTDKRITVHGFVEDVRPLYSAAWAVVAPLDVSAGTNIKVLESMACGKALVTTPAGCAGLGLSDGREALIRLDSNEFARALRAVFADPALRSRLSRRARATAEKRFSWLSIADTAYGNYLTLTRRSPGTASRGEMVAESSRGVTF